MLWCFWVGFASLADGVYLVVGNVSCGSSIVLGETEPYIKAFLSAGVVAVECLRLPGWDYLEGCSGFVAIRPVSCQFFEHCVSKFTVEDCL